MFTNLDLVRFASKLEHEALACTEGHAPEFGFLEFIPIHRRTR